MDVCLERKPFHYFLNSVGTQYIEIGTKKDLYDYAAKLVVNQRKVEPNFLGSICVYDLTVTDLIGIFKQFGYHVLQGRVLV